MYARNPNTGGTIRIMKSDVSLSKNRKTLVWMKPAQKTLKNPHIWARYDIIVSGLDPILLAQKPNFIILTESNTEPNTALTWLSSPESRHIQFLFISLNLVRAIGIDVFQALQLGNVICLDEFAGMYPYLGAPWNGTIEDGIICVAALFRYSILMGVSPKSTRKTTVKLTDILSPPEELVLIQQYYKPAQNKRFKELQKCLKKNLECPYVDRILLFMESDDIELPLDSSNKITKISHKARLTFADCIEAVKANVGPNTIVVFANTDIYLDESWKHIWSIDMNDICVALLRWEEGDPEHTIFGPRNNSQDSWAFYSDSILSRTWKLDPFKIPFGKAGCDNAILVEFLRQKFKIVNPARTIKTIHVHKSEIRTYNPTDIVDVPAYLYVEPSQINELDPILTWDGWTNSTPMLYEPFDRPLKSTGPKMLATFCSHMNRDPSYVWSALGQNVYIPTIDQDKCIDLSNAFVNTNGTVYSPSKLFIGQSEAQTAIWTTNRISHLTPTQSTDCVMAFPLDQTWFANPALYMLYYLSKVLKQHLLTPNATFWCENSPSIMSALQLFRSKVANFQLLQYTGNTQVYAKKIVGRTYSKTRLMPSDIKTLRNALQAPWNELPIINVNTLVIITDPNHIHGALLNQIETLASTNGYHTKVIDANTSPSQWLSTLSGVSNVILSSSPKNPKTWPWLWMAPRECKFLELQEERDPTDELLHLASAGGQEWTLLQYPRCTPDGFQKIIMKEVARWLTKVTVPDAKTTVQNDVIRPQIPIIYTPPKHMKHGFFGHSGDTFREMIDLWVERGFVERREDPMLTLCWFGGVGKTLLYDRPTWDWLTRAPSSEKSYVTCLAGNPNPTEKPKTVPWIFWPRQPRLVDRLVSDGLASRGFSQRTESLVFYGRIENSKQGEFRTDIDGWRNLCSQFSMPTGAKEPYALSPEEYLKALGNSKFGLCLRGFGPKCNREIELLAAGCVPIITPGVDIKSYKEPLVDGRHVIVASTPEEAKAKMESMTSSEWLKMSREGHLWWERNASVEGAWNVTSSLV